MSARPALVVLAGLAALASLACTPRSPAPDGAPTCASAPLSSCALDRECTGQSFCDLASGCCVSFWCQNDGDCGRRSGETCNTRTGQCEDHAFCADTLATDADVTIEGDPLRCGDGVCLYDGGKARCFESAPAPFSCVVTSSGAVTVSGRGVRMEALALDRDGAPAADPPPTTWAAANATVDGDLITATCTGASVCDVIAVAHMGAIECAGGIRVFAALPAGSTRMVLVDARTRAPLVHVRVDAEIDGVFVVGESNGDGAFLIAGAASVVSAFPEDHEWHTVIDPPAELVIASAARGALPGKTGAVDFTRVHTQGDLKVALTGLALPSLLDASLERFLGVPTPTRIELEGLTAEGGEVLVLPSSLTLFLGDNPLRGDWLALGDGGLLWSFGGHVPLAEIGPILTATVTRGAAFGELLAALVPALMRSDHFVGDAGADVVTPAVPMVITRDLLVGPHAAPNVLALALARVPGRGFVPLGFGRDALAGEDGEGAAAPGVARVAFAPPHDGLEGSEMIVAAVALDCAAVEDSTSRVAVQAAFAPLGDSVAIAMPAFLVPVDAAFDGVWFKSTNDVGADLYRVRFDDGADARWTIWSTQGPPTFALDELHAGDVNVGARAVFARVEALAADALAADAFAVAELPPRDRAVQALSSSPLPLAQ